MGNTTFTKENIANIVTITVRKVEIQYYASSTPSGKPIIRTAILDNSMFSDYLHISYFMYDNGYKVCDGMGEFLNLIDSQAYSKYRKYPKLEVARKTFIPYSNILSCKAIKEKAISVNIYKWWEYEYKPFLFGTYRKILKDNGHKVECDNEDIFITHERNEGIYRFKYE
jgi:hypothetical protein